MNHMINHAALMRMDGLGIVVLGAGGGGIGTAVARLLAAGGARIMCVDNVEEQAQAIACEVKGHAHVADITNRAQMEQLFARSDSLFGDSFYGLVDIVGATVPGPIESFDDVTIDRVFAINLRHALMAVQIAGPMLAARKNGAMTFISTLGAERVASGHSLYDIAKAGLNHLVRHAADEFGPYGVRSNAIGTGFIGTPAMRAIVSSAQIEEVVSGIPMRRIGEPEDIAGGVYFLMSRLASYVNGEILHIDGGNIIGSKGSQKVSQTSD